MKKLFEARAVVLECQAKQRLVEKEIELEHLRQKPKREWQGLTDGEKAEIQSLKWWDWEDVFDLDGYTRAIEAKLKEKNT